MFTFISLQTIPIPLFLFIYLYTVKFFSNLYRLCRLFSYTRDDSCSQIAVCVYVFVRVCVYRLQCHQYTHAHLYCFFYTSIKNRSDSLECSCKSSDRENSVVAIEKGWYWYRVTCRKCVFESVTCELGQFTARKWKKKRSSGSADAQWFANTHSQQQR